MDLDNTLGLSEAARQYMAAANETPRLARESAAPSLELQKRIQELTAPPRELQRLMQELLAPSLELQQLAQKLFEPSWELGRLAQEMGRGLMDTMTRELYGQTTGQPSAAPVTTHREVLRPAAISTPAPALTQRRGPGRPAGTTYVDPEEVARRWKAYLDAGGKTQKGFAKQTGIPERTVRRYLTGK